MADNRRGRDKQARDADRRQRERAIATELERMDEPEPPLEPSDLAAVEAELEEVSFPATGAEIVRAVGDEPLEGEEVTYTVAELTPDTESETFESPAALRRQIQRPTIAAAMKAVIEATATDRDVELTDSQREAYEKTFRELKAIDADDDDEGIAVIRDWIVDQVTEKGKLPGSRGVRREAAKFCRENGYEIRNDEWLGI